MTAPFIHPTALVETEELGPGTRVWAYAHVLAGAVVGANCNIGDHAFVETGAMVGNNVTIKNHVCIWEGVTLEDDVFVGPLAVFTNDLCPRSPRMPEVQSRYAAKSNWLARTVVGRGCTIGANATLLSGLRIGEYSFIAASATVTKDVEPFSLMVGTPAARIGYVCRCGRRLEQFPPDKACAACGTTVDCFPTKVSLEDR